ncbi:MAG: ATP-binding protein [bacterium]
MNLLRIINKIISSSGNSIIINEDYCVRLKSPMSSCYVCINKCPEQAIEINDSNIKISDKCSLCKLCINICPNFVFDSKEFFDISDKAFISENKTYYFCSKVKFKLNTNSGANHNSANDTGAKLNKSDNFDKDNSDRLDNENSINNSNILFPEKELNLIAENSIKVISCINEIDNTDIIKHLKNNKEINFITADCNVCDYNFFYKNKIKKINRILTGLLALDDSNPSISEKIKFIDYNKFDFSSIINIINNKKNEDKASEINLNSNAVTKLDKNNSNDDYSQRRLFFQEVSKTIKENAVKLAKNFPLEELPFNELFLSNDDKKLNKLFFKKRFKLFNFIKYNPDCLVLLDIKLPSINKNCVFCSNCWEFCPTGALTCNNKNNAIRLNPYLCTECNLCKDICSFGAIKMNKSKNLNDISGEKILFKKTKLNFQ